MPHRIDIDGISKRIFILNNLAFASKPFCETFQVDRGDEEDKPFGWTYYLGWLKSTVSESLIDTAIKIRVMNDFLKYEELGATNFREIEGKAISGTVVGRFLPSFKELSLRETCNKIIHAIEMNLKWIDGRNEDSSFEFWNGNVILEGVKGKENWKCELNVITFCVVVERLLSILENEVDWHHIYKYDE